MRLNLVQQAKVREQYGICVNEACNSCGKVLAEIRYTRRGESGEWCSEICRDGAKVAAQIESRRQFRNNSKNTRHRIMQARLGRESAQMGKNAVATC
jgi:hypothetical protein